MTYGDIMKHAPKPMATSAAGVPPEWAALTERWAEHARDLCAKQCLRDGLTYGPQRDDQAKKHPCLSPDCALPESEKEHDRQAALGTLKAILALGWRISKS